MEYDHIYPQSKGGKTVWTNIVSSCRACNRDKADKTDVKPTSTPIMPVLSDGYIGYRRDIVKLKVEKYLDISMWNNYFTTNE